MLRMTFPRSVEFFAVRIVRVQRRCLEAKQDLAANDSARVI